MAQVFSEHFAPTAGDSSNGSAVVAAVADVATALDDFKVPVGIGGARKRYKKAYIQLSTGFDDGDVARMIRMKSGDRIHRMILSADGANGAGVLDIGLYKAGANNDGAVIDDDLFGAAVAITTAIDQVDTFDAGVLNNWDRGKTLWECANIGAGTYYADPMEEWDICFTCETADVDVATEQLLEIEYTAGD